MTDQNLSSLARRHALFVSNNVQFGLLNPPPPPLLNESDGLNPPLDMGGFSPCYSGPFSGGQGAMGWFSLHKIWVWNGLMAIWEGSFVSYDHF